MKPFIMSLVGVGCIGAAGLGGYMAVRSGTATSSAAPAAEVQPLQHQPSNALVPGSSADATHAVPPALEPAPVAREPRRNVPAARPEPVRTPRPEATPAALPARDPASAGAVESQAPTSAAPLDQPIVPTAVTDVPAPVATPAPDFEEITVPGEAVVGIRLESPISSATARIEDRVAARVTRDVNVDGRTAIPSGSVLEGTVTAVERGGKFRERARIGIRFTTIVLADSSRVPIQTETIFRTGDAPGGEATAKIGGGAVVGAILGAVVGGKKGAAIGSTAGAAGGTAAVMAGGPNDVVIPVGTTLTVRLTSPATIQVRLDR